MLRDRLAARLRRAKIVAALRGLNGPAAATWARRAFEAARRRPDAVVAIALAVSVLAMILHWR